MKTPKTDTSGPAFPGFHHTSGNGNSRPFEFQDGKVIWEEHSTGMSLRDYFAAKAMLAMMTHEADVDAAPEAAYENLARSAYEIADAMLAARLPSRQ